MRVLVTGDMGHLGQRIRRRLEERGHEVAGYDIRRDEAEEILDAGRLAVRMLHHEVVVHAAAIPHPRPAWGLEEFWCTNVVGSYNVFRAAAATKVRRVVFLSSVGFYGVNIRGRLRPAYFPIDESHPLASQQPGRSTGGLDEYNQSKVLAEELLAYYGTNGMFEAVALRIGPANTKATQYPDGFDWRKDHTYRRWCLFSNCHPDYAAEAAVLAVESRLKFGYESFNIFDRFVHGSISIVEFIKTDHRDVPVRCVLHPHACLFSTDKAERVLGWEPCTDLE